MAEIVSTLKIGTVNPRSLLILRLYKPTPEDIAVARTVLGIALPDALYVCQSDEVLALWVGPGEWLLVGADHDAVTRRLSNANGMLWHCSEMLDAYEVMSVEGEAARTLFAKGCSLDLHPYNFPVGRCAGTVLAQIDIVLHKLAQDSYNIYCDRSWAGHLREWMNDAAYGIAQSSY
jgi:sarcosine oxidase, subunit gamma